MANTIKIKATFHDSCGILKKGEITHNHLDYDYCREQVKAHGGEIFQWFIDEDGYKGMVFRPYDCSEGD